LNQNVLYTLEAKYTDVFCPCYLISLKGFKMAAQTTMGTGPGSAADIQPKIYNGVVKSANLASKSVDASKLINSPVLVTDSTVTVEAEYHADRTIVLKRAAGVTVTLPAATGSGNKYSFVVGATVTSNNYVIKVANGSDSMVGRALAPADSGNTVNGWEVVSGDDTITLNGSTKGGYIGDTIELIDVADNIFVVNAFLNQTSTEATPFSATVS